MEMKLPFSRLVCPACAGAPKPPNRRYQPDYMIAEVAVPAAGGLQRKVAIDVLRMKVEDSGNGLAHGHVTARVPCISGGHAHDIDITDVYRAPQLHLAGQMRCAKGHAMELTRVASWEYVDEGAYGGQVLVSAVFQCPHCGGAAVPETLRLAAPAPLAEEIVFDLAAAVPAGP